MFSLIISITTRIFSNSYLNVMQKVLTNRGETPSVINFYTYLGLSIIGLIICPHPLFRQTLISDFFIMGLLGAIGNYFIIKALSCGELSILAPINSYKPIIALILGIFLLNEIPNFYDFAGILLIILGTIFLSENHKIIYSKPVLYRFLALLFSASEAIYIKKIILITNVPSSFLYWALASFIFTLIFVIISKHKIKISNNHIKFQFLLIILVALMQYSTNYVFSKINVASGLALFQLSTIISVFLGAQIFKEKQIIKKLIASLIMMIGAITIILF